MSRFITIVSFFRILPVISMESIVSPVLGKHISHKKRLWNRCPQAEAGTEASAKE